MRKMYSKLVRDHIPEIIRKRGGVCEAVTLSEEAYRQALLEKLVEEAREAAQAGPQELATELADLQEVIDAVMAIHGIERDAVLAEQERRRAERGGFDRRIRLVWTD
jgi:predicted house-cleaning noncanonical NTP pyrophosphatase (MazG superfamily)